MFKRETVLLNFRLFLSTLIISAVTFGGGYVIISVMKKKFVDELGWIEEKEMLEMTAIAQSCPGAIAVNTCILLGYRMAGVPGAMIAVLGAVLPPFAVLSVISLFYDAFREQYLIGQALKGMQAGVAALLADVMYSMGKNVLKEKNWLSIAVMAGAFIAVYCFKINVIFIILACGIIGFFSGGKKEAAK